MAEYVLTHRSFCDTTGAAGHRSDTYSRPVKIKTANEADRQKFTQGGRSSVVNSDTCRYCQARGHWKRECPALKARRSFGQVKPAVMAAPVITSESRALGQVQACTKPVAPQVDYSAFRWMGLFGRRWGAGSH